MLIITEGTKLFAVGGLQHFRRSGAHLNDMTSHPTIINFNQSTATTDKWGHSDLNIYPGSLESRTEVKRGEILQNGNDSISMKPPRTIGGIIPQVTGQDGFNLFVPIRGASDLSDRSVYCHGA